MKNDDLFFPGPKGDQLEERMCRVYVLQGCVASPLVKNQKLKELERSML